MRFRQKDSRFFLPKPSPLGWDPSPDPKVGSGRTGNRARGEGRRSRGRVLSSRVQAIRAGGSGIAGQTAGAAPSSSALAIWQRARQTLRRPWTVPFPGALQTVTARWRRKSRTPAASSASCPGGRPGRLLPAKLAKPGSFGVPLCAPRLGDGSIPGRRQGRRPRARRWAAKGPTGMGPSGRAGHAALGTCSDHFSCCWLGGPVSSMSP